MALTKITVEFTVNDTDLREAHENMFEGDNTQRSIGDVFSDIIQDALYDSDEGPTIDGSFLIVVIGEATPAAS